MKLQKLTLVLIASTVLVSTAYASTAQEYPDEPAASSAQSEAVGVPSEDSKTVADTQPTTLDPATPPVPADTATEPEKAPLCSGVANCAGQVVKGVVGGIVVAAVAVLYIGLATGLIFLL